MSNTPAPHACDARTCGCSAGMARRDFLRWTGFAALGATIAPWPALAGPFTAADFEKLIPSDKKLSPAWLKSLTQRGTPEIWRGHELAYIGMPIGGICTGQLYLGGDGRLWHWDIFQADSSSDFGGMSSGIHYTKPPKPTSPLEQGFAIRIVDQGSAQVRELDGRGFAEIAFRGEYPIARVQYRDPACPVSVDLESFSPFVPLDADASGLPATVFHYTVKNQGPRPVEVELAGWLQNAVCQSHDLPSLGLRRNTIRRSGSLTTLDCSAEASPVAERAGERPDILFEDFEKDTYEGWTVEGTAFGAGPVLKEKIPGYQGDVGGQGRRVVNSHASAPGDGVSDKDGGTGRLTSKPFTIGRDFITFFLGGGKHPGKTCLNLLVDGEVVATVTGHDANAMLPAFFDVSEFAGQTGRIEIVDAEQGAWANIGVDHIVFTDTPPGGRRLENTPGYGTFALSLLGSSPADVGVPLLPADASTQAMFTALREENVPLSATRRFGRVAVGALSRQLALPPGQSATATFVLTWHFPNYPVAGGELAAITDIAKLRRHYAAQFTGASDVAAHVAGHFDSLAAQTRLWNQTWYDSTLPYWFLDRTFLTIDTLATQTCHWFDNGRFYGWEGVNCCAGTCQHVWQYAQAVARIFPQLERDVRQRVDFGLAWRPNGAMDYRAESGREVAHDGFAGTLLRVYREHQMSPDNRFLQSLWPRIKTSLEFLLREDKDGDGLLEGRQYNTLDAAWFGPMGWISSLYLAAVQAGRAMATEMGDVQFAQQCERLVETGRRNLAAQLFNGEYFIHKPDPKHPEAINTNAGCHIDQVFGQSFAWQLGLDRVVSRAETVSALQSLWKYNFTPDIGPYRNNFKAIKTGRWYAMPGEGGLLMCTWPKGGAESAGGNGEAHFVGYFNECMTGFEYQAASHMVWEGKAGSDLVEKGLAITRMIHDRYQPSKRNPYNEIECSDHYSRAMASYGVFLAACGYEYHGPQGHLGFAPRLTPERFKAPFTAAEGWGTYSQERLQQTQTCRIELKFGQLRLQTLAFQLPPGAKQKACTVELGSSRLSVQTRQTDDRVELTLDSAVLLNPGKNLTIQLECSA